MLTFQGATPSREKLRKAVSKELGSDEKLTFIRHVYQRFGSNRAKVIAHIYNNEKDAKLIEDQPTIKRHHEEKKEEAKAEEKAQKESEEKAKESVEEKGEDKSDKQNEEAKKT